MCQVGEARPIMPCGQPWTFLLVQCGPPAERVQRAEAMMTGERQVIYALSKRPPRRGLGSSIRWLATTRNTVKQQDQLPGYGTRSPDYQLILN
jgi:hypothetical protein